MSWLMWFATVICQTARKDLCARFDTPPILEDLVFEADELCTYVGKKAHKVWIWIVMERETRQIIAFEIGDRSADTCEKLWAQLEKMGIKGQICIDLWSAYPKIFPPAQHASVEKRGATNPMKHFNGTARAYIPKLVRRTYSFAKKFDNLVAQVRYFLGAYNLSLRL